jgi:hypothetical protein
VESFKGFYTWKKNDKYGKICRYYKEFRGGLGADMETNKLIINGIFYVILTTFFIFLWLKEKKVVAQIRVYRDRFSESIIKKLNIKSKYGKIGIKKNCELHRSYRVSINLSTYNSKILFRKFYGADRVYGSNYCSKG